MAESDTTFLTPVTPYTSQLQGPNIRLLRLAPGEREAPIACSLVDASLDSLPPYEALSYVWGDPTITEPIMCNGLPGRITINLARALRRIRAGISLPSAMRNDFTSNECLTSNSEDPSYFPKLLWVDALCIDQDNTHERNIQVPLMREIYSSATRVIAWLGDVAISEEHTLTAVMTMRVVNDAIDAICKRGATGFTWKDSGDLVTIALLESLLRDRGEPNIWPAVAAAFSSAWFTRVWCVQETTLARDIVMLYEHAEVDKETIGIFCKWVLVCQVQHVYLALPKPRRPMRTISRIYSCAQRCIENPSRDHLEIVEKFRGLSATDPRDKIYGLLGLMNQAELFEVNYNSTVFEVLSRFIIQLLPLDFRFLMHVDKYEESFNKDEMPSWLPRWDKDQLRGVFRQKSSPPRDGEPLNFSEEDVALFKTGTLRLKGLLCGSVDQSIQARCSSSFNVFDMSKPDAEGSNKASNFRTVYSLTCDALERYGFPTDDRYSSAQAALATAITRGEIRMDEVLDPMDPDVWLVGSMFLEDFISFDRFWRLSEESTSALSTNELQRAQRFSKMNRTTDYRIFFTMNGWVGLGPARLRDGDTVAVFNGVEGSYILRPAQNGKDQYYFMGYCWMYDLEYGKAYKKKESHGFEVEVFDII